MGKLLILAARLNARFPLYRAVTYVLAVWLSAAVLHAQTPSAPAGASRLKPESYRRYALTHEGDVTRGAALFAKDERLGCAKCHSIDGQAGKAGPDLFAAGDKFGRRDLVDAVMTPSAVISPGYGTVLVETRSGEEYQGTLKSSNADGIELMGADGKRIAIPTGQIKAQRGSAVSLMPEGLFAGLSESEFTDLIEYLTTLKQPESNQVSHQGIPGTIPEIAKPVALIPFVSQELTLPRGRVQTGLTSMRQIPGSPDAFLVLHQKGMLWRIDKTAAGENKAMFLDLTGEVFSDRGPNGLLDVAFHPKFRANRKYYLKYQVFEEGKVCTLIMEKQFSPDFKSDSGQAPRRVMKFVSVAEDHSGGCLQFGPDGYLYIVMGDTGPHNDPNGHAQNLKLLLGKLLRIDVDRTEDGLGYSIPADNPFRGRADARPEIWAYGFRNPWRFSFDRLTQDLWLADVGQDRLEEVEIVRRGENHGWNVYEGFEPFSNQYRQEGRQFVPPLFAYKRRYGISVTGGHVYRGDKTSSFYGVYICGDYVSKRLFGVAQERGVLKAARQIGVLPQGLVSFTEDESGRLYAVGYEGMIYALDFSGSRFDVLKAVQ